MVSGLILLVLIGALVAFGWTRLRGRMNMSVSAKHWLWPILVVVVIGLLMWSKQHGH